MWDPVTFLKSAVPLDRTERNPLVTDVASDPTRKSVGASLGRAGAM